MDGGYQPKHAKETAAEILPELSELLDKAEEAVVLRSLLWAITRARGGMIFVAGELLAEADDIAGEGRAVLKVEESQQDQGVFVQAICNDA